MQKKYILSLLDIVFTTGCSNKTLNITPESNIINKEPALQIRDIQVQNIQNVTKEN